MKCPNCNNEVSTGSKFCNHCGAKIEMQGKTCPNPECGRTGLPPEAVYCADCGSELESASRSFLSFTETVNGVNFDMIAVKGGTFRMGSNDGESDEKPIHSVTLSNFYIGKYEVTQALWQVVMGNNPSYLKGNNLPVENVSWNDCQAFISKLNQMTGKRYRLPTEAQWEFAARGGIHSKGYIYAGSNNINEVAEYKGNNCKTTKPVGGKKPNELGLYDMSGNVWEWCSDWYGSYNSGEQTNPTGVKSGSNRVYRGGSWFNSAQVCRVAYRSNNTPADRYDDLSFRLVLVP